MAKSSDTFKSGTAPGIDELLRAANAAGYAMAAEEGEAEAPAIAKTAKVAVSLEDSARGARAIAVPAATPIEADTSSYIPKTVRNGAHSVRDTVYGYLGYGVPA